KNFHSFSSSLNQQPPHPPPSPFFRRQWLPPAGGSRLSSFPLISLRLSFLSPFLFFFFFSPLFAGTPPAASGQQLQQLAALRLESTAAAGADGTASVTAARRA
ncbi:hypothetical protein AABB24_006770, partial [Solanum stoloniferum]